MILKAQRKYTRSYTRNATPGAYVAGSPMRQNPDGTALLATGNAQNIVGSFFNTAAKENNVTQDGVWDGMTSAEETKTTCYKFNNSTRFTADSGVYPYNSTAAWVIGDSVFVNNVGQWDRVNPSATFVALENRWGRVVDLLAAGGVTTELEVDFIDR